jgi:hypothetical protein
VTHEEIKKKIKLLITNEKESKCHFQHLGKDKIEIILMSIDAHVTSQTCTQRYSKSLNEVQP